MKRTITLMLVALPLFATFAQKSSFESKGKFEIDAGYGVATAPDIMSVVSDMLTGSFVPEEVESLDTKGFGAAFVNLNYYVSNRFTVGLQYNYASFEHLYGMPDATNNITLSNQYNTLMLRGKGVWLNRRYLQLYSSLAAGPTFAQAENEAGDINKKTLFAFQASPIGIRVGNRIAFFAEAGVGFEGIVSAGISARF